MSTVKDEKAAQAQHTPGPWQANGHMVDFLSPEGNLITVASTNRCWHGIGDEEANARLIASAPDLLEAARAALRCDISRGGRGSKQLCDMCRDKLERAIAKAGITPD